MNSNPEHTASTLPKLDAFLLSDLRDAKVLVQFGGQGSGYLSELAQLVKSFETVRDLVSRARAALEHTALANEASCILHSLLLADHELTARLSKSALSWACVSYPLVFLTQLASHLAFLETGGLTHQRFLPMIQGGTGHSQGLVAAVLLAAATTQDNLVELGLQFVQLMHYHGVLAQATFDAVNDGVPNVVGTVATHALGPSAMSAYSHASLADIAKWMDGQPMFDSLFAFQQWPARRPNVAGVDVIETWKHKTQVAQHYAFELLVKLPKTDEGLVAMASFQPDKLSSAQARAILHEFDYTMTQLCSSDAPSTSLALWTSSEAQTAAIRSASFGPTVPLPFELLHHA
ncbi:hypothetical protein DYB38_007719 [Aphanomyces astaci]|uniref:Starter acyltransferase (SAT) domain-containing protein n=1 Tax=Aphanomyces astaci TaxID=112090 RepID=A0A397DUC2_APHAT|nr:hypothetical protein DYB38_007719 [Aphanomyces astaci]